MRVPAPSPATNDRDLAVVASWPKWFRCGIMATRLGISWHSPFPGSRCVWAAGHLTAFFAPRAFRPVVPLLGDGRGTLQSSGAAAAVSSMAATGCSPPPRFDYLLGIVERQEPCWFKHSPHSFPLNDSIKALPLGLLGRLKPICTSFQ